MMLLEPPFPFIPGEYRIRHASEAWERRAAAQLRRTVFCEEQRVFEGDDEDAIDAHALPIVAVAWMFGMPDRVVGTVRIHRDVEDASCWWGSRLAVAHEFRGQAWIGSELIRHAVTTAHARGCARFVAHVQSQNVPMFRHVHWQALQQLDLHGRSHHLMQADLAHYPPRTTDEIAFVPHALRTA